PSATTRWSVLDRTGEFEWHDHRIHWMSPLLPPEVKDQGKRTKIFEWQVPIAVGARPATIEGQLFWVPEEGTKTPAAAIVALVAIVLLGMALVLLVRRRRGPRAPATPLTPASPTPPADSSGGKASGEPGEPRGEAW
ncbi:MAG: hypothetical protein ACRDLF_16455, partial [Solirubrobacteraceae bacterium]